MPFPAHVPRSNNDDAARVSAAPVATNAVARAGELARRVR